VLFLFVVMLVDFKKLSTDWQGFRVSPLLALTLGVIFFIQSFLVIYKIQMPRTAAVHGTAENIGRLLFSRYALPFELTSLLLLAAVVSVVVLAKKGDS
jgi:NADH-quinone oxidoreductase subunit J